MKIMRFSRSANPLRNQKRSVLSAAAAGLRQSAATRWAGAGFNSADDKGAALTIPDGKADSFIAPDQQRFNVPGSTWGSPTEYKLFMSCNDQLSVRESRRGIHARAVFTSFRELRIERGRVLDGSPPRQAKSG